jgi:hypothetical protein
MDVRRLVGGFVVLGALSGASVVACGSSERDSGFIDETADTGAPGTGTDSSLFGPGTDAAPPPACVGLECNQVKCEGGGDTTVTGTVFAPNGKLPLYNAIVYVPNQKPKDLTKGATCDQCGAVASGNPVVTALSQSNGTFTLKNVPVGTNVPMVIQIGKWRRQVVIPEVKRCTDTRLDPELTRLPKNRTEGDLPRIALTSGGCDNLGCMLPKVGIDASEFGTAADGDSKAIHVYLGGGVAGSQAGGPAGSQQASTLWNDVNKMKNYDMLILSCECTESPATKNATSYAAMTDYLKLGGRIFTTDFMYTWYRYSPDNDFKSATNIKGGAPLGTNPVTLDQSFPKGKALAEWMKTVFPASTAGSVPFDYVFDNFNSVDAAKAQVWGNSSNKPRIFTVNLPVGVPADKQCGKGVHIDAHVNNPGGTAGDAVDSNYPRSCTAPLKEGEASLAFFFFDLASCIQNEKEPPPVPPVPK